ncbi:DEAD/DEAH box helicase [Microbispora triticiradicis]|uniref:DEAD/DEAH box helicase n=1 Tax=Microbispora triticiradicis TaxID=2200763 RepID=A0ABX9LJU9_9ACTN|nr:protein DpdJ [Microbispora triticiradicis]RGA04256.1 DEAD/DEAH box helicase [Microbispora triticiradicis]
MTGSLGREFVGDLLNKLEDLELPLLSWGITEGALSEIEVLETIFDCLAGHPHAPQDLSPEEVLDKLRDSAILFQVPAQSPRRYRTRFAETLRLTAQLRQLFPWHKDAEGLSPNWWLQGRRLVADYRLYTASRRYPRRDIPAADALQMFRQTPGWGPIQEQTAAALIGDNKLAQFQVAATQAVFGSLPRRQSTGVIVGAGTGSGKTLAFYLPALTAMAEHAHPGTSRLHTLALYPRKELLRDQLRDALLNTLAIEPALREGNRRPLRIGVLYADTPWTSDALDRPGDRATQGWQRRSEGFICPYLTCPRCTVGDLLWSTADRQAGSERLSCVRCRMVVPPERLALTRRSIQNDPPDLLFTTTEMLNRNSTNPGLGRLLGWSGHHSPSLVLLDEVHTYSGPHGAQVALLLRRWRHAVRKPVTFVGLSATLKDASQFFAELTGLPRNAIEHIEPNSDDMDAEGREYAIALRGDPVSGASLLSTSIQTAMLFGRMLDPQHRSFLFGSTGFLFTDDLDVTNRFYNNLRHAEGRQARNGFQRQGHVLAGLRSPELPQHSVRYGEGQSWDLIEKIGHHLDPGLLTGALQIGRTSSQDAGVDLNAHLTVATASLEVGFNDPRVGLVMQHKAPHDAAAFIQRRGRAGRSRGTRPITVVTLSDFGRDRLSYQGYETLFAPEITARSLPIRNRYVLKIQASQALLDWLSRDLQRVHPWDDPRALLTAPYGRLDPAKVAARQWLVDRLEKLLTHNDFSDRLARHLQAALQVSADEAQALLWEQPRSLLLAVVPTALRRLRTGWEPLRNDPGAAPGSMLPEFVTRSLFDPLNLPEVEFELPFETGNGDERLPVARALREAVPGRVSRRYGYRHDEHRTWIPIPQNGDEIELTEALIPEAHLEGEWRPYEPSSTDLVILRPFRIRLHPPPPDIVDQSQGSPQWGTQIVVPDNAPPNDDDVVGPYSWQQHIRIGFSTHAAGNPIEVRRMTYGADCDIIYRRSSERRSVRYTFQGRPAALGFSLEVDAIRIELDPVDLTNPRVQEYLSSPKWRSQVFFRAVAEDQHLAEVANTFKRDWLALIYFTAFSLAGLDTARNPEQIRTALADGSWRDDLAKILSVLYREDESSESQATTRLVEELTELSHDDRVVAALDRAGQLLTAEDVAARTEDWARRAYRDTFGAAVLAAALRACPDAQERDLIIDIVPGATQGSADTIWLTETSIGGLGVVEHLVRFYAAAPQRFWSLVSGALRPNEYEYIDATVTRLLRHVVTESPGGSAAAAIAAMRNSRSAAEADCALRDLRKAWTELDGIPRHAAVATLSTRLLRPGSNPETDETALRIIDEWAALEQRLAFEVDARVIAYAIGSGDLRVSRQPLRADQAFSLMWPRGARARSHHLHHYHPYTDPARPAFLDRLLVETAHDERLPRIELTEPGWEQRYQKVMAEAGAVDLVCPAGDRRSLSEAIAKIPAIPVDRDVLRIYGELENVTRSGNQFITRVVLREAE